MLAFVSHICKIKSYLCIKVPFPGAGLSTANIYQTHNVEPWLKFLLDNYCTCINFESYGTLMYPIKISFINKYGGCLTRSVQPEKSFESRGNFSFKEFLYSVSPCPINICTSRDVQIRIHTQITGKSICIKKKKPYGFLVSVKMKKIYQIKLRCT